MAKPKITRIKANETVKKTEKKPVKKVEDKKEVEKKVETTKKATKKATTEKKVFILFRPFVAFFRYVKGAFSEIRQVRWPSRKATWKMVLAVLVYTALFIIIISLLDLFFTWLFSLILK